MTSRVSAIIGTIDVCILTVFIGSIIAATPHKPPAPKIAGHQTYAAAQRVTFTSIKPDSRLAIHPLTSSLQPTESPLPETTPLDVSSCNDYEGVYEQSIHIQDHNDSDILYFGCRDHEHAFYRIKDLHRGE